MNLKLKKTLILFFAVFSFSSHFLSAEAKTETGYMTLFVFKDELPFGKSEVIIDSKINTKTDKDGYLKLKLPTGKHQLQIIAKSETSNLIYVKKPFIVEKDKNTQLMLTLNENYELVKEDNQAPVLEEKKVEEVEETQKKEILSGIINLSIVSSENKSLKIKKARVFVKGSSVEGISDKNGRLKLTLPEGNYTISVIHAEFSAQTIRDIVVSSVQPVNKVVALTPASMELQEFIVLAPHVEGSVASIIAESKKSSSIVDILGSDQISKKGDSSAAGALKRVTGVTLVGGKNIYVRGLGERYSNIQLNGLSIPAPNPLKRNVPLDIFPAGVIGSLNVQKTFTANIPGNFAGGYIDIKTKKTIKEDYVKVSASTGFHSSVTKDGLGYEGSNTDFLGFDDGSREMSDDLLDQADITIGEKAPTIDKYAEDSDGNRIYTTDQIIEMSKSVQNRKYNTSSETILPNFKGGLEIAKYWKVDENQEIGVLGSYSYGQSHKLIDSKYNNYRLNSETNKLYDQPDQFGTISQTSSKYSQNAMLNLSYLYGDVFDFKFTKLYLLNSYNQVKLADGILGSNDQYQKKYYLEWEERSLDINQFTGTYKYKLFTDMELNFGYEFGTARVYQPNNFSYDYVDSDEDGVYNLDLSLTNLVMRQIDSKDEIQSFYLKNKMYSNLLNEQDFIEVGIDYELKERTSRTKKFYLKDQTNNSDVIDESSSLTVDELLENSLYSQDYSSSGFLVQTLFSPSDFYDAELDRKAGYLTMFLAPTDEHELFFGLRKVNLSQTLFEYTPDETDSNKIYIKENKFKIDELLPSFSYKYKYSDDDQLKFAFSQSFIYPDFREFSNAEFFHPDEVATIAGNPDLKKTDVTSLDLRYEHYFSPTESSSASIFYKNLDNPIEDTQKNSTSLPIYSYMNSERAVLYGFEIDGYKNLSFINEDWDSFYISGNYAYIISQVYLNAEQKEILSTYDRDLQGLSPFVVNLSVGYDNGEGRAVTLSYNKMAERLMKLGLRNGDDAFPDTYETPPHLVDFVYMEDFKFDSLENPIKFKFKVGNLLDSTTYWKQSDKITKEFQTGREVSMSASMKF